MALHLTGLSLDEPADVVDCLILAADHVADTDGEQAAHRLALAHRIGDALDALPPTA
ncbi:hypothetical protein [Streptomyces longwoodensis]|uniref:hypothetical protein n=1 Tax=Streptomyces longwoodensis TaxID=68231 RepID=UPI002259A30B|nr:hypothetical protein [Streptomyces longwoodensis]MCX4993813.1 hypothetical protein [Streptomyces longwoodensis]MCX4998067.1 hypothetical protein [Streptomyces longwoodensis]